MHYLMHRVAARAPPCENPSTTGGEASTLSPTERETDLGARKNAQEGLCPLAVLSGFYF